MSAGTEEFSPMDYFAIQNAVSSIKSFKLTDVGSPKWIKQQTELSQLNIQAHLSVQQGTEQTVVDSVYTEDKMKHLIHELIAIEHWKKKVYPKVAKDLIASDSLYHEAVLINLFEVLFYHKHIVTSIGDSLVDLVDYCMRKMSFLSSFKPSSFGKKDHSNEKEYFEQMMHEMGFTISLASLSVFRYITDVIHEIPLSVMDRILHRNDMICASVDLIEKAPWIKKTKKGIEVFEDGSWKAGDIGMISKVEGQLWLILYNLLIEPECRKVFQYDERNYEIIQRLRGYFQEGLTNQIPILESLWRHLEELAIVQPQLGAPKSRPVIEELPEITTEIVDELTDVSELGKRCKIWLSSNNKQDYAKSLANVYNLDTLEPLMEDPKCASCGQVATNRCSRCKTEWYCGRPCQVNSWKIHKSVCDIIVASAKIN